MRLAIDARGDVSEELLAFGKQLGATDAIGGYGNSLLTDKGYYDYPDLVRMRKRFEDAGLTLAAIENVPPDRSHKIKLGLPGRDQQIENWCKTLTNMGRAGIPVLGYNFMLRSGRGYGWRTVRSAAGRGGARVTTFDYDIARAATQTVWDPPVTEQMEVTDEQMWDNFTYFLKAVIPVAERAGVRMGLHPDDPPISPLAGVARIFRSHSALQRLIETVPSDYNGLDFCQGTISEMPENVIDAIRYFGSRGKIFYVHFRNVSGPIPSFSETFIDEGHVNMAEAMQAYSEAGFDGPMIDDHVPGVVGDKSGYRSRAFAMGYIKGLMDFATPGALLDSR